MDDGVYLKDTNISVKRSEKHKPKQRGSVASVRPLITSTRFGEKLPRGSFSLFQSLFFSEQKPGAEQEQTWSRTGAEQEQSGSRSRAGAGAE